MHGAYNISRKNILYAHIQKFWTKWKQKKKNKTNNEQFKYL